MPMLSTVTSVLFLSPHSLTYFSLNHLSKAGTKCTHWIILRVFLPAAACDFRANTVGPSPVAITLADVVLMNSRRVIFLPGMSILHQRLVAGPDFVLIIQPI